MMAGKSLSTLFFSSFLIFVCLVAPANAKKAERIPDTSGVAPLGNGSFLVVHDKKGHKKAGGRIGVITVVPKDNVSYEGLKADWSPVATKEDEKASDLESVCALPGRPGEFLVGESSYREKKYGRIIHLRIDDKAGKWTATVLGKVMLPTDTVNVEGMACLPGKGAKFRIILGERGLHNAETPARNHNGKLRWGTLDLAGGSLEMKGDREVTVNGPEWAHPENRRDISDLYVDAEGVLWGTAAEDPDDDNGPFRSLLYRLGPLNEVLKAGGPIAPRVERRFDGFKVEALSAPAFGWGMFSIVTDDEKYGGAWRPLY